MKFVYSTWNLHSRPNDIGLQDDYRLPEGMKRTGYDADTGRYYFTDQEGNVWEGAQGAEFSEMTLGALCASSTPAWLTPCSLPGQLTVGYVTGTRGRRC